VLILVELLDSFGDDDQDSNGPNHDGMLGEARSERNHGRRHDGQDLEAFEPSLGISALGVVPADLVFQSGHHWVLLFHRTRPQMRLASLSTSHKWNVSCFSLIKLGKTALSTPFRAMAMILFPFSWLTRSSQSTHLLL